MPDKRTIAVIAEAEETRGYVEDQSHTPPPPEPEPEPKTLTLKSTSYQIVEFRNTRERDRWSRYAAAHIASGRASIEERDKNAAEIVDKMILRERIRNQDLPIK